MGSTPPPLPAGMDIEAFRKAGYAAVDSICDYYTNLRDLPVVAQVEPGYLVNDLPTEAPTSPEPFPQIISDFQSKILPGITHWAHPNFYAYFPATTNFESILADMMATSVSNPGFNWSCSPACTELEQVMLDWGAKLLGLDETFWNSSKVGGGQIATSASESCLIGAVAARERAFRLLSTSSLSSLNLSSAASALPQPNTNGDGTSTPSSQQQEGILEVEVDEFGTRVNSADSEIPDEVRERFGGRLIMYGSTQTHSLGVKAARILGLKWRALPTYRKDNYSLTAETVKAAIAEDEAKGLIPFMIVGTIGTTSSGTVDHLADIGELLKSHPTIFLYVDAAWAGVALSVPEYRSSLQLAAVNQYVDAFCTNFHKWGLVAFDCSGLWVRDRNILANALDVTPAFLRTKHGDSGVVVDYRNWSLSLGRRFRSLKMWFVMRSYGADGFRNHIRSGVNIAEKVETLITNSPNFELVAPRSLALLVFRLKPKSPNLSADKLNELNNKLQEAIHARNDFNMTQTVLPGDEGQPGINCMRFALGGLRNEEEDAVKAWQLVETLGAEVLKE